MYRKISQFVSTFSLSLLYLCYSKSLFSILNLFFKLLESIIMPFGWEYKSS